MEENTTTPAVTPDEVVEASQTPTPAMYQSPRTANATNEPQISFLEYQPYNFWDWI